MMLCEILSDMPHSTYFLFVGWRNRPDTSLLLYADQTITFPSLQNSVLGSFTFAVHFKLVSTGTVHLVNGLIKIDDDDIIVR
mgnify:FL=1